MECLYLFKTIRNMKLYMGSDHAGFDLKSFLVKELASDGHDVKDKGTHSAERTDYPDFAHPVAQAVEDDHTSLGILICGSANGVAMAANKHAGVRCAIAWQQELAALARQHNNANILALPARFVDKEEALEIARTFLTAQFEGGRHQQRVEKIACA